MKHTYQDQMKNFMHDELVNTVKELKLTEEETAEILGIETRSYAYLKCGKTMCSATTLLVFLARMCTNPMEFIEKLKEFMCKLSKQQS